MISIDSPPKRTTHYSTLQTKNLRERERLGNLPRLTKLLSSPPIKPRRVVVSDGQLNSGELGPDPGLVSREMGWGCQMAPPLHPLPFPVRSLAHYKPPFTHLYSGVNDRPHCGCPESC